MKRTAKAVSAILLLTAASTAMPQPEPLGRLFFTPEQRTLLDRQRQFKRSLSVEDETPITLNGKVSRSTGRNTAWINGVPMDDSDARKFKSGQLQPGQTIRSPGHDDATDLLNGGTITIHGTARRR